MLSPDHVRAIERKDSEQGDAGVRGLAKSQGATRNGRAVRIVKSSFHNYSYELRLSYASTKNPCSEPLELSPPILDSSTSAPAKKKRRKGKRTAEKRDIYMYIFYEVSSVESASQKARSPPPPPSPLPLHAASPRAIYSS